MVLVSALDVAMQSLAVTDPDGARVRYAARPTDQLDPWAVIGAPSLLGATPGVTGPAGVLPAGVGLTGGGGLEVAGLELLGARAYDPSVRGFLSTDPLPPVLGAGWDGNPYAYAGNNPLNATDPTGLRPLNDEDLKAYDGSIGGSVVSAVGDWWKDNWEYVAGGAMVVAGGALMATGVGGPAGMMLIGAGADTIIQKATTGDVNWGQVALTGAVGLVAGPLAGRVGPLVASGVGRAGTAVSSRLLPAAGRIGSAAVSGASRAGAAVSAAASRAGSAVASGVSRVGTSVGGYVARLPGRQMVRSAVSNGIGGGAVSTGMYYGTTPRKDWSTRGGLGALAGGFLGGAVGGQREYLRIPPGTVWSSFAQYGLGAVGSLTDGHLEHAITGEDYSKLEMGYDSMGRALLSRFPGASDFGPNPSWMMHSFAAYGGAHAGAIVESAKFVGVELIEEWTGISPW